MEKQATQPRVIIFTTPTCTWCNRVKSYLRQHRIRFRDIDVTKDASAARDLERRGHRGVPVLFIGSATVVGFDQPKINSLLGIK
ncbi:MAG: glutaredoxin family protein [Candidatus Zhuqueibacterota bacterium]